MNKKTKDFGKYLKKLRIKKDLTLREASRKANYDASNWSKIERGKISPPSNKKTLKKWAGILGLSKKKEIQNFIDKAQISQGIIPKDIFSDEEMIKQLPAFFKTLRNKKPTKKEINKLIELLKNS